MSTLAGKFLVARSLLQDANFRQSVVLLLQHGTEGAFGLVVNRPAKAKGLPFPVFNGGPCRDNGDGLLMLHGHEEWTDQPGDEPRPQVAPGVFLGDATCLARVNSHPEGEELKFRMFTGYAGWGPDQLESELAMGAWTVVPASGDLLFDTPFEELWDRLSPPTIPQPSLN
jgi:putative transcriptional regulator